MSALHARKALLRDGWADNVRLELAAGRIRSVDRGATSEGADFLAGIIVPGVCNAHSHAFQRALVGRTERRSRADEQNFWSWRREMYRLAAAIDSEAVRVIAGQVYAEMLMAGYTSVAEFHYLHHAGMEAIVSAAADVGIRLTLVPVLYERAGFDDPKPDDVQRLFVKSLDDFRSTYENAKTFAAERVNIGVGIHSLRAVSADSIDRVASLARNEGIPLHIHLAEQQREVDDCLAHLGTRPARWLLDRCDIDGDWCLVHATHLEADEIRAIARSGAVVCVCPSTEANLGDGIFPLQAYLREEGSIAIGSDSQVTIDPFEELRWLEYGQRLFTGKRNVSGVADEHSGSALFDLVTNGGARACGRSPAGIEVGAPADLLVLDDNDPMFMGHRPETLIDALVFSGYRVPLDRVMVHGEWKVIDGTHIAADEVLSEYRRFTEVHG